MRAMVVSFPLLDRHVVNVALREASLVGEFLPSLPSACERVAEGFSEVALIAIQTMAEAVKVVPGIKAHVGSVIAILPPETVDPWRVLECGADFYGISTMDVATMTAMLRTASSRRVVKTDTNVLRCGNVTLELAAGGYLMIADHRVHLPRTPRAILTYLMRRAPDALSTQQVLSQIYTSDDLCELDNPVQTLRTFITKINATLRTYGADIHIGCVWGYGHRICEGLHEKRKRIVRDRNGIVQTGESMPYRASKPSDIPVSPPRMGVTGSTR